MVTIEEARQALAQRRRQVQTTQLKPLTRGQLGIRTRQQLALRQQQERALSVSKGQALGELQTYEQQIQAEEQRYAQEQAKAEVEYQKQLEAYTKAKQQEAEWKQAYEWVAKGKRFDPQSSVGKKIQEIYRRQGDTARDVYYEKYPLVPSPILEAKQVPLKTVAPKTSFVKVEIPKKTSFFTKAINVLTLGVLPQKIIAGGIKKEVETERFKKAMGFVTSEKEKERETYVAQTPLKEVVKTKGLFSPTTIQKFAQDVGVGGLALLEMARTKTKPKIITKTELLNLQPPTLSVQKIKSIGRPLGEVGLGVFFSPAFATAGQIRQKQISKELSKTDERFKALQKELSKEKGLFAKSKLEKELAKKTSYEGQIKVLKKVAKEVKTEQQLKGFMNLVKELQEKQILKSPKGIVVQDLSRPAGGMFATAIKKAPSIQKILIDVQVPYFSILKGAGTIVGGTSALRWLVKKEQKKVQKISPSLLAIPIPKTIPKESDKILLIQPLDTIPKLDQPTKPRLGQPTKLIPKLKEPLIPNLAQPTTPKLKTPQKQTPKLRQPQTPRFFRPYPPRQYPRWPPLVPKPEELQTEDKLSKLKGRNQSVDVVTGMQIGRKRVIYRRQHPFTGLKKGLEFIDRNIEASVRLVPNKAKPTGRPTRKFSPGIKFRPSKRNPLYIVEKRAYRLDSPGEKRQIKLAPKKKRRKKRK